MNLTDMYSSDHMLQYEVQERNKRGRNYKQRALRSEVLTAVTTDLAILGSMTPCSLVVLCYRYFGRTCCPPPMLPSVPS